MGTTLEYSFLFFLIKKLLNSKENVDLPEQGGPTIPIRILFFPLCLLVDIFLLIKVKLFSLIIIIYYMIRKCIIL